MINFRDLNNHPPRFNINDIVYVYVVDSYGARIIEGRIVDMESSNGYYDATTVEEHIELDSYQVQFPSYFMFSKSEWFHSYELMNENQAQIKKEGMEDYHDCPF